MRFYLNLLDYNYGVRCRFHLKPVRTSSSSNRVGVDVGHRDAPPVQHCCFRPFVFLERQIRMDLSLIHYTHFIVSAPKMQLYVSPPKLETTFPTHAALLV